MHWWVEVLHADRTTFNLCLYFILGPLRSTWNKWLVKTQILDRFLIFGPHFDLYQSLSRLPIWNLQNCGVFHLAFVVVSLQGHWWGFISRNYVAWPIFFLTNVFIALKETHFLCAFTAAGVVQYDGRKMSPRTSTIVQFIFHFWSFEISVNILRNQKLMIGLDTNARQVFDYLDPFWFISVFESAANLKFAKLRCVPSCFRFRVITGSLMRVY